MGEACAIVDVSRVTVNRWATKGREGNDAEAMEFAREFDRIRAGDCRPLTRDDLIRLLERQARKGSIRAVELLLRRPWETTAPEPPADPMAELDAELAAVYELRRN